jgi:enoyl-CoA hydratase
MSGYLHLEIERSEGVATLWLNRPEKLNALSADMWADLPDAMAELDSDDSVRAVVLAGRGRAFTVGIDFGVLATLGGPGPERYQQIRVLQETSSCLANSAKPVIAAIQGHCLGGGMGLITACDVRYAARDAVFSIRETRLAIVADVGTLQRLPSIVGSGHTAELAFTGSDIDAARAHEIGLVNRVFPDHEATIAAAMGLAARIAANSPAAVQGIKRALAAGRDLTVAEALDDVARWNAEHLDADEVLREMSARIQERSSATSEPEPGS